MSPKLKVCSLTGDLVCHIATDDDWSVLNVKVAIEKAIDFPKNRQRLLIGGSLLRDQEELVSAIARCLPDHLPDAADNNDAIEVILIRLTPLKKEWIDRVKKDGLELRNAPDSPRCDPIVTLAAVEQNGLALACAHRDMQADFHTVLAAVRQNGLALMHAATNLRADEDIVMAAIQQNPLALKCATSCIQANPPKHPKVAAPAAQHQDAFSEVRSAVQRPAQAHLSTSPVTSCSAPPVKNTTSRQETIRYVESRLPGKRRSFESVAKGVLKAVRGA